MGILYIAGVCLGVDIFRRQAAKDCHCGHWQFTYPGCDSQIRPFAMPCSLDI